MAYKKKKIDLSKLCKLAYNKGTKIILEIDPLLKNKITLVGKDIVKEFYDTNEAYFWYKANEYKFEDNSWVWSANKGYHKIWE